MPVHYLYLLASVLAEAIGFAALNTPSPFTRLWPSVLIILGFGGSFYFLTLTLQYMALGVTYALTSGLGIIVVAFVGVAIFGQKLDLAGACGLALIIAGIAVINLMSNMSVH